MSYCQIKFQLIAIIASLVASTWSHECLRACQGNDPRTCSYEFFVGKSAGDWPTRLINGTSPGPPIEICLGDTIEIVVENGLSSEELSFHWHGVRLAPASVHMDGVPMITQCPIFPYTSYRYEIQPETSGTYFYHAHSVTQQADGLYGSLIVRDPEDNPGNEIVLIISSRSASPLSELLHPAVPPRALILNGRQSQDFEIEVDGEGKRYLIRLINANAYNCPISMSVEKHKMEIIASDGHFVESGSFAERIIVFPGERFDLALRTDEPAGKYVIDFQGHEDCHHLQEKVVLNYRSAEEIQEDVFPKDESANYDFTSHAKAVRALDLRARSLPIFASVDNNDSTVATEIHYIPFDVNSYDDITDGMTDYTFNIDSTAYFPTFLSTSTARIAQINRMSFEYPPSPIISQPDAIPEDTLCSIDRTSKLCEADEKIFCQCTQILQLPAHKTIDIFLIDEGFGGNSSHTFHVHGHAVGIIGIGQLDRPARAQEIMQLTDNEKLRKNAPVLLKDSFVVPNKGYVALRIRTDNIGYWLWEARSTGLYQPALQFVIQIGNRENLPALPIDYPKCGSLKGPASIFEDAD